MALQIDLAQVACLVGQRRRRNGDPGGMARHGGRPSIGALAAGGGSTAPMEARTVFSGKRIGAAVRQQDRQVEGIGRAQDRAEVSGVLDAVEQEHAGLHPERALLRQAQGE